MKIDLTKNEILQIVFVIGTVRDNIECVRDTTFNTIRELERAEQKLWSLIEPKKKGVK